MTLTKLDRRCQGLFVDIGRILNAETVEPEQIRTLATKIGPVLKALKANHELFKDRIDYLFIGIGLIMDKHPKQSLYFFLPPGEEPTEEELAMAEQAAKEHSLENAIKEVLASK